MVWECIAIGGAFVAGHCVLTPVRVGQLKGRLRRTFRGIIWLAGRVRCWWSGEEFRPKTFGEAIIVQVFEERTKPPSKTHTCVDMRKPMSLTEKSFFREKWRPPRTKGFQSKLVSLLFRNSRG